MPDPRGKLPSDIANADWDALLSDLEQKVDDAAKSGPQASKSAAPPSASQPPKSEEAGPASQKGGKAPGSSPFYRPPAAGANVPAARASGPAAQPKPEPKREPPPMEDLDEERTMVGTISRELIEEAARGGVGLGQLLGSKPPREQASIDVELDDSSSRVTPVPPSADVEEGVLTSAPNLNVGARKQVDDEVESSAPPSVEHGDVPDPFADPRPQARGSRPTPPPLPPGKPLVIEEAAPESLDMADPFAAPPPRPPAASVSHELDAGPKLLEPEPRLYNEDEPTRIGKVVDPAELRVIAEAEKARQTPPSPEAAPSRPAAPPPAPRPAAGRPATPPARPAPPAPTGKSAAPAPAAEIEVGNERVTDAGDVPASSPASSPRPPAAAPAAKAQPRPAPPAAKPSAARPSAAKPAARVSQPEIAPVEESPMPAMASVPSFPPVVPDTSWADERDAVAHLADMAMLDEWSDRATWLEAEARAIEDRIERARALISVSELLAMGGEEERAQTLADEARELAPNLPLAQRQGRAKLAREGAFEPMLDRLDAEIRVAPTPAARAHALVLSAEISRLASHDVDLSDKKLEQAARVVPSDPRPHVLRLVRELALSPQAPRYRVPDEATLSPIAQAVAALSAHRGSPDLASPPVSPVDALTRVRLALGAGQIQAAITSLASLDGVAGVGTAALWLASSLAASTRDGRERALGWLAKLSEGNHPDLAARARAARAFEQGDVEAARAALSTGGVFSAAERAAAGALVGAPAEAVAEALREVARDDDLAPLAAAIALALHPGGSLPEAGSELSRAQASLGRAFGSGGPLAESLERLTTLEPDSTIGQALKLELDVSSGNSLSVAQALSTWPRAESATADFDRDRALAASLVYEIAGDKEQAASEAESARQADPSHETPVRVMAALRPDRAASEIDKLAADIEEPVRRALLLLEAATRLGPQADAHAAMLRLAHETAADLPFASALGLRAARLANDKEALLAWVRTRREATEEPAEAAFEAVREALLVLDGDRSLATHLLEEAARARPDDVALRELLERTSPEPLADRAQWRAARADRAGGTSRAQLALAAALELERARDFEAASRYADLAVQAGAGELAKLVRDRCDTFGSGASRLSEELMAAVRSAESPAAEREAYERLAYLDEVGRGDVASGLLWHRSILEKDPSALPSLRRLEHALVGEGREDELEPIFAEIAKATTGGEAIAHAIVAARLRQRTTSWDATRDLAQAAAKLTPPSVWALRQLEAHSLVAGDDDGVLRSTSALAERTDRPAERAALLLRSAEAMAHKGDAAAASDLLKQALELQPQHPVAHGALAQILEKSGELRGAAEALEASARVSLVAEHQVQIWYDAAVLWLDKVGEQERGVAALEAAAALDILFKDTFDRLSALYTKLGEREKLARLLERRLEREEDPAKKVELEVTLGRALTDVGDLSAAKRALAAALEGSPDHVEALKAFADLCGAEGDWDGAEQATIRLARLVVDPEKQAEVYMKLGGIYQEHLPNNERAELAYLEVLKRLPESVPARERLVSLYASMGERDKALEIQQALLAAAASNPAEKRQRTIEMARLHETVGGDVKKAEQTLEAMRKELPHDTFVLRALAEFHTRHNHTSAVNVLLDRAAADARRALTTGRFELHFFANLATVFELRGNTDAAHTAQGTVNALEGKPCDVTGVGLKAARPDLDDHIAPDIFTAGFRELLRRAGSAIDLATAVDLKALRATPPPPQAAHVADQAVELAAAFGIHELHVLVSPAVGPVCMPISANPPTLVYGAALVAEPNEAIRHFLTLRALKIIQGNVAAFSRTAPIDLWPMTAAFLQTFAPSWNPQGVDANKLKDYKARIQKHLPPSQGTDLGALALEIGGAIGNRASTLQTSANAWGDRCALLATGDATAALDAIAWASGQPTGAPAHNPDRMRWIGRNAEARDVMVWSVSDGYGEARHKALGPPSRLRAPR